MDFLFIIQSQYKIYDLNALTEYLQLCKENINTEKSQLTEAHHILPKSIFKDYKSFKDNPWNRVYLTYKNHYLAHILLAKAIRGKMLFALNRMFTLKKYSFENIEDEKEIIKLKILYRKISAKHLKSIGSNKESILKRVINRILNGNYIVSNKTKLKQSNSKLGTKLSNETKNKISKKLKNIPKTKEHNEKVRLSLLGKKHSQERINNQKIAFSLIDRSANKNPSAIRINIYNDNNILMYECFGTFDKICKENNLPNKALRKSYYNNGKPIYTGKTIKKEILIKYKNYINWYALKIEK